MKVDILQGFIKVEGGISKSSMMKPHLGTCPCF